MPHATRSDLLPVKFFSFVGTLAEEPSQRSEAKADVEGEGAVGCTVVQDKGSAVPYHGSRTFLNELAAFPSRTSDQGQRVWYVDKRKIRAAFVHRENRFR